MAELSSLQQLLQTVNKCENQLCDAAECNQKQESGEFTALSFNERYTRVGMVAQQVKMLPGMPTSHIGVPSTLQSQSKSLLIELINHSHPGTITETEN